MDQALINQIAQKEDLPFKHAKKLKGGDINSVYELETGSQKMVLKINSTSHSKDLFEKEVKGLELLRSSNSFIIPEVYRTGAVEKYNYLLIEKIEPGEKPTDFWKGFATSLAKLHAKTSPHFGLEYDNYIGLLPQYNQTDTTSAADFLIENRLRPQFKIAYDNGFTFSYLDDIFERMKTLIPDEKPALIHGDLWANNFLTTPEGKAALIDPAVSYAPREMELAMMKLFGGFDEEVFSIYNDIFPLEKEWENRVEMWKLYFVLVHLNIFGFGFLTHVRQILQQFR